MRLAAVLLALAACSDTPGPDPELPLGSWRQGAWTCLEGCEGAPPALTAATWLEVSAGTVRWLSAAGAVLDEATGGEDGLCWRVPAGADHGALDVCGAVCDEMPCAVVERATFGAQAWRFDAVR